MNGEFKHIWKEIRIGNRIIMPEGIKNHEKSLGSVNDNFI
jgi:hypothetical protein